MPNATLTAAPPDRATALAQRYAQVRAQTLALAAPLSEADAQAQSMPEASPAKWHLAHVTWFFETFVLEAHEPHFKPHHPAFRVLFNSYYQGVGDQHPRPQRGLITRPGLAEVRAYRAAVDARMRALLEAGVGPEVAALVELGLQHEQQHQELLLTDVLHLLSCNPLQPLYRAAPPQSAAAAPLPLEWVAGTQGVVQIGHGGAGFAFDNEGPRHSVFLRPHALAHRLTTQGEWLAFMADGGYRNPRWWLAEGWDWLRAQRIEAPLYWQRLGAQEWQRFSLHGPQPLQPHAPVAHISLYEADAYARWAAAQWQLPLRLPTEAEWEPAAARHEAAAIDVAVAAGAFVESGSLQPQPLAHDDSSLQQLFGSLWQWTSSAYLPHPGFRAWDGAVGEYNGKFMVNQTVLRGGSCATPRSHIRASYRNFFPAATRWQFNGLRLARDME